MGARSGRAWGLVALVAAATAVRLVYLVWWCPYTLAEDEAHYWEWSRRPDWSYYTKGPGVAWAIGASVRAAEAVGAGVEEWTVRIPAAVAGAVLALAVGALARDVSGRWRAGLIAAWLVLLAPVFQAMSLLMTIDGPYLACWGLAAWGAFGALHRRSRWGWVALGVGLGLGFLFKYTIVLLVPGLAWYVWRRRGSLACVAGWRVWASAGAVIALAGVVPVIVWNARHEWYTVAHLLGHLGIGSAGAEHREAWRYDPRWTLELIGTQVPLLGGVALAIGYGLAVWWKGRGTRDEMWHGGLYLVACAVPVLVFYLGVSVLSDAEANWPVAGWVTLTALAGCVLAGGIQRERTRARDGRWAWRSAVVVGVVTGVGMLRLDLIAGATGLPIPLGRLTGADELGASADAVVARVRAQTGLEPFVMTEHYGRASQLAFYMAGRPRVYCANLKLGRTPTAYDFWADTDPDSPGLMGRPALLFGATGEEWERAFARVEALGVLRGDHKRGREAYVGYGYRGFGGGR